MSSTTNTWLIQRVREKINVIHITVALLAVERNDRQVTLRLFLLVLLGTLLLSLKLHRVLLALCASKQLGRREVPS
jgi:hypothetical protein